MEKTGRFSRTNRILKRGDFEDLQNRAEKLHTKFFLVAVRPSAGGSSRLGVTVTKRVTPRAVERNRIKRRMRECFRRCRGSFKQPLDIVIIARRDAQTCSLAEITRAFVGALKKRGFIDVRAQDDR